MAKKTKAAKEASDEGSEDPRLPAPHLRILEFLATARGNKRFYRKTMAREADVDYELLSTYLGLRKKEARPSLLKLRFVDVEKEGRLYTFAITNEGRKALAASKDRIAAYRKAEERKRKDEL